MALAPWGHGSPPALLWATPAGQTSVLLAPVRDRVNINQSTFRKLRGHFCKAEHAGHFLSILYFTWCRTCIPSDAKFWDLLARVSAVWSHCPNTGVTPLPGLFLPWDFIVQVDLSLSNLFYFSQVGQKPTFWRSALLPGYSFDFYLWKKTLKKHLSSTVYTSSGSSKLIETVTLVVGWMFFIWCYKWFRNWLLAHNNQWPP